MTFYDPHNEFGIVNELGHRVLRQYRVGKVTVTVTEQPDGQISRAYRNHQRCSDAGPPVEHNEPMPRLPRAPAHPMPTLRNNQHNRTALSWRTHRLRARLNNTHPRRCWRYRLPHLLPTGRTHTIRLTGCATAWHVHR